MLEKDLSMRRRQNLKIQSNELKRRLYNVNEQMENKEKEVEKIVLGLHQASDEFRLGQEGHKRNGS